MISMWAACRDTFLGSSAVEAALTDIITRNSQFLETGLDAILMSESDTCAIWVRCESDGSSVQVPSELEIALMCGSGSNQM